MSLRSHTRGFTLIELLVVISIIGLFTSIILTSLNTAKNKANDAARVTDVKSLKTAMELYYNDNNTYPQAGLTEGSGYNLNNATFSALLVPTYIRVMPSLLVSDGDGYVYRTSGGNGYGIHVYTATSGWCVTGVNINTGWWTPPAQVLCNF